MADIDGNDLTEDNEFSLFDGFIYFKTLDGEFSRASNIKTFFEKIGIGINRPSINVTKFLQEFDLSTEETSPDSIFLNPSGTKMFISGLTDVYEYNVITPFDVSTSVYVQNFDTSTQDTNCNCVTFNDDGTKMYICGDSSNSVHEYDLSGAYSLTSVVFNQSLNVSAQENFPRGLDFSFDGSKMYIVGAITDAVNEWDLSTDFDISTAVYSQNFDVSPQSTNVFGVTFTDEGDQMFICTSGGGVGTVYKYLLASNFDVSTASFSEEFPVTDQETASRGIHLNSALTKMYITGGASDSAIEYDLFQSITTKSITTNKLSIGTQQDTTISGGEINVAGSYYSVDTEGGAATDDLDTINGGKEGDVLILTSLSGSRVVTVKNGTGNIVCGSDRTLTSVTDILTLIYKGSGWRMQSFRDNG